MPPVRGVARPTSGASDIREQSRRACTAARVPPAVVLARCSVPERVPLVAPTTPAAERGSAGRSGGADGLARLLVLRRPEQHLHG
jgi:hypothetical protein